MIEKLGLEWEMLGNCKYRHACPPSEQLIHVPSGEQFQNKRDGAVVKEQQILLLCGELDVWDGIRNNLTWFHNLWAQLMSLVPCSS